MGSILAFFPGGVQGAPGCHGGHRESILSTMTPMGIRGLPRLGPFIGPPVKAAMAVGLLFWALRGVSPELYRPGSPTELDTVQSGEMLLHGFNYGMGLENFHLPLATISGALIVNHAPAGSGERWRLLSAATAFLLILSLGVELSSFWGGLFGAGLLTISAQLFGIDGKTAAWHGEWGHLQTFHSLLVLAVAGAAARQARAPSLSTAALAGAALGAALLYRSTLVFLPPLLAAHYVWRARRASLDWRQAALLGLAPYLFLVPWIAMNWSVHQRFIPLENGEAAPIIIGGVLGAVDKDPSPALAAKHGLESAATLDVLAWAVPRVLARPADYAIGFLRRLARIALMSPLLLLLAAAALWARRRRAEYQAVGLLCSYLVLIHGFMSFLVEYFEPLWPLLAVLAGTLLAAPFRRTASSAERGASLAVLRAFLCVALLLCLFVFGALADYARAVGRDDQAALSLRIEEAVRRHPADSELVFHRGMRRFRSGDVEAAARDLQSAARLPYAGTRALRRGAWIGLYLGRPEAFLAWLARPEPGRDLEALLLKAYGYSSLGRLAEARAAAAELRALSPSSQGSAGLDLRNDLRPFVSSMCARAAAISDLEPICRANAEHASQARRLEVQGLLLRASRAQDAGEAAEAARLIDRAAALGPEGHRLAAQHYQRAGLSERAAVLLSALIAKAPRDAGLRVELAQLALKDGRRADARASLAAARGLTPDSAVRHRIALLHQELGDYPAAVRLLEQLAREDASNAVYRGDLGLCRFLGGQEARAVGDLEKALELDPRLAAASLTLGAVHSLNGRFEEAARVYDSALRVVGADAPMRERLLAARSAALRRR